MAAVNGNGRGNGSRNGNKGRALLRVAFSHTLERSGASHAAAARWLKKRLARHFCSCLALAVRKRERKAA